MAVLKQLKYRVKASTLMETLVASVLIVIIFMLASMIMNQLFTSSITNNTQLIRTHLNELRYRQLNDKLNVPYYDTFQDWEVRIELDKRNTDLLFFEAQHQKTHKIVSKVYGNN